MKDYGNIFLSSSKKVRYRDNKWKTTIILLALALVTWLLTLIARDNPKTVERLYSSTIYPYIAKAIGWVIGIFPISVAEVFLGLIVIALIVLIILILVKPRTVIKNLGKFFHYGVRFLGVMYILFYFLWGFNYYREDYMKISQMNNEPATLQELKELTADVINNVNLLRRGLEEDENGVFIMEDKFSELSNLAQVGFEDYNLGSLNLGGKYGRAKPVLLSKWMSYTGISGIYIPYTTEPNINIDIPHSFLPVTICHEIAHQRGFAKEDEANFIAYRASVNNPDERFRYSGYYLAMNSLMNDLYVRDQEAYSSLYTTISDKVKRDLDYDRSYWKSKEGPMEELSRNINDNYLKANNQEHGVASYSRVVELLLAEYKSRK